MLTLSIVRVNTLRYEADTLPSRSGPTGVALSLPAAKTGVTLLPPTPTRPSKGHLGIRAARQVGETGPMAPGWS